MTGTHVHVFFSKLTADRPRILCDVATIRKIRGWLINYCTTIPLISVKLRSVVSVSGRNSIKSLFVSFINWQRIYQSVRQFGTSSMAMKQTSFGNWSCGPASRASYSNVDDWAWVYKIHNKRQEDVIHDPSNLADKDPWPTESTQRHFLHYVVASSAHLNDLEAHRFDGVTNLWRFS